MFTGLNLGSNLEMMNPKHYRNTKPVIPKPQCGMGRGVAVVLGQGVEGEGGGGCHTMNQEP